MIAFDDTLRRAVADRLRAHPRRQLTLDGRRHAAVAIVLVDSDFERHDVDPVQEKEIDWAEVPGYPWDAAESARLAGRMVGVAGGAAFLLCRREYSAARDTPLSAAERQQVAACALLLAAYIARCEHCAIDRYVGDDDPDSFTTALRVHGSSYLSI